ncbi:MAG TPA: 2-oxoacid:acceptor oxidoreductase family protein [Candidatus Limnocylindria bacterium]
MPPDTVGVLVAGVGGQGVILASAIVADAARRSGRDVKQSEVHGMAQRGGVVTSHLRFGETVRSPLIELGGADVVLACEWNEAIRAAAYLRPGGTLITSALRIVPPRALADRRTGRVDYPDLFEHLDGLDLRACDAEAIARRAGHPKAGNTVLVGVLAGLVRFADDAWRAAIAANVPPKALDANLRAFDAGRALRFARPARGSRRRAAPAPVAAPPAPRIVIDAAWCKGADCSLCVRACPERCLGFDGGTAVVATRPDACTGCRLCEIFCPDFAIVIRSVAA